MDKIQFIIIEDPIRGNRAIHISNIADIKPDGPFTHLSDNKRMGSERYMLVLHEKDSDNWEDNERLTITTKQAEEILQLLSDLQMAYRVGRE